MSRTSLVTVTVLASLAVSAWTGQVLADDPIAALNRAIQDRFKDVDKTFGLRRIVIIGDTPHQFRPESVSELAVVQELTAARMRVALYVAGRRVLDREPDLSTKEPLVLNRRVIFGPVSVTAPSGDPPLPAAVDLIPESRVAFVALQKRERHDFELAGWMFSARAVRATSSACLTCHQGRRLGDPLGIVLYAYQKAE